MIIQASSKGSVMTNTPESQGNEKQKSSHWTKARLWTMLGYAFVTAVFIMFGMPIWFPAGIAGINNMIIPMLLFPLVWAVLFFYAVLEKRLKYVLIVLSGLTLLHMAILSLHLLT